MEGNKLLIEELNKSPLGEKIRGKKKMRTFFLCLLSAIAGGLIFPTMGLYQQIRDFLVRYDDFLGKSPTVLLAILIVTTGIVIVAVIWKKDSASPLSEE